MNVVLGVSRKRHNLDANIGENSYWCVFASYGIQPGDLLAMYYTAFGIAQIYKFNKVIPLGAPNEEFSCQMRKMRTAHTTLLARFEKPLTAKQMKKDPLLMNMNAVRRSFQATSFIIDRESLNRIIALIRKNNPNVELDSILGN